MHFTEELDRFKFHPHVGDVRQVGMMVGIELIQSKTDLKSYPVALKMGARICQRARHYGVMIRPLGNVLVLMPPYNFSAKQLKKLCRMTYRAMDEMTK